jgi:hypothetical protein
VRGEDCGLCRRLTMLTTQSGIQASTGFGFLVENYRHFYMTLSLIESIMLDCDLLQYRN